MLFKNSKKFLFFSKKILKNLTFITVGNCFFTCFFFNFNFPLNSYRLDDVSIFWKERKEVLMAYSCSTHIYRNITFGGRGKPSEKSFQKVSISWYFYCRNFVRHVVEAYRGAF